VSAPKPAGSIRGDVKVRIWGQTGCHRFCELEMGYVPSVPYLSDRCPGCRTTSKALLTMAFDALELVSDGGPIGNVLH